MITPKASPSRELLEQVAEDFRQRGYEVLIEPRGSTLPDFLTGARPDMIAHRGDEHLVVEVKSSTAVDQEQLQALSRRVAAHPGWRFVLMARAAEERLEANEESALLDEESIKSRLHESRTLMANGHPEAALVLAWASLEALLRLIAAREGVTTRSDPVSLLRSAASEGWLRREDYDRLNHAFRLRNVVVHGFRPTAPDHSADTISTTKSVSSISESILSELRKTA